MFYIYLIKNEKAIISNNFLIQYLNIYLETIYKSSDINTYIKNKRNIKIN